MYTLKNNFLKSEVNMKPILLSIFFLPLILSADIYTDKAFSRPPVQKVKHVIDRPVHLPIVRPLPVVVNPGVVYQDNYYNTSVVNSCQQYVEQIAALQDEIVALKSQVALLESQAQQKLQQSLKTSYEAELKKFENRKSSTKSHNSVIITEKPTN